MANNEHRTSQLIFPFGVGAMVDFKDDTLMAAGLDFWPSETKSEKYKTAITEKTQIIDPRLQMKISSMKLNGRLNKIEYFLNATEKRDFNQGGGLADHQQPMPFVRFPTWYFCSNCKKMKHAKLEDRTAPKCHGKMFPVTFLIACEDGHISDFPWVEWVHHGDDKCQSEDLSLESNTTPGLPGVVVKCNTCKKRRSLGGVYPKPFVQLNKILPNGCCPGEKPWLGSREVNDNCSKQVDFIQRASSSAYFPNTISSILIPPYSDSLRKEIDKPRLWNQINGAMEGAKIDVNDGVSQFDEERLKITLEIIMTNYKYPIENVIQEVKKKYSEENDESSEVQDDDITFRKKEYLAFLGERPVAADRVDFDIIHQDINLYDSEITSFISDIVLVTKLRETRVLTGFSRIVPTSSGEEKVSMKKAGRAINWLPATEVRGEGIFLNFKKIKLQEWYNQNKNNYEKQTVFYRSWLKKVQDNEDINYARISDIESLEEISPYYILVHTFAHILIRQLVYNAGYDASSLRERLFVSEDTENEMYGVLIYTSSGDSEGTLGGLVERGKPGKLEETILKALAAETCSNDPICLETERQGLKDLNGAACHSCALLPETSCEHNNTLLDRAYLFGTADNSDCGFFSDLISNLEL